MTDEKLGELMLLQASIDKQTPKLPRDTQGSGENRAMELKQLIKIYPGKTMDEICALLRISVTEFQVRAKFLRDRRMWHMIPGKRGQTKARFFIGIRQMNKWARENLQDDKCQ